MWVTWKLKQILRWLHGMAIKCHTFKGTYDEYCLGLQQVKCIGVSAFPTQVEGEAGGSDTRDDRPRKRRTHMTVAGLQRMPLQLLRMPV